MVSHGQTCQWRNDRGGLGIRRRRSACRRCGRTGIGAVTEAFLTRWRYRESGVECRFILLQLVSKPLSAKIGCKARGSAFLARRVLNAPRHAFDLLSPRALITTFSLNIAIKQLLKPVVGALGKEK